MLRRALLLLLAVTPLHANFSVTLAWDPNPETDIASYAVFSGAVSLGTTPATVLTLNLDDSWHGAPVFVIATNVAGLSSSPSYSVLLPGVGGVTIKSYVQISADLASWIQVAALDRRDPQIIRIVADRPIPIIEQSNDNGATWSLVVDLPPPSRFARLAIP